MLLAHLECADALHSARVIFVIHYFLDSHIRYFSPGVLVLYWPYVDGASRAFARWASCGLVCHFAGFLAGLLFEQSAKWRARREHRWNRRTANHG